MNRRGFLQGILGAAVAPVFIRAEILMPTRSIILPPTLSSRAFDEIEVVPWSIVRSMAPSQNAVNAYSAALLARLGRPRRLPPDVLQAWGVLQRVS